LECLVRGDASTELWATERKSDLFQEAFRRGLILRMRRISARPPSPRPAQVREAPLWLRMREVTALTAAP
jgi:hypothetical protein